MLGRTPSKGRRTTGEVGGIYVHQLDHSGAGDFRVTGAQLLEVVLHGLADRLLMGPPS